jgi:succinoglycan biosynthesis transport protein ExoP
MDFLHILKILQRKTWVLITFPLLTIIVTGALLSRMDKKYKSTAQIATGFTTNDAVKLNDDSDNPFEVSTNFTNIIESMNSIPVMSLVSYRLVLHDLESTKPFRTYKPSKDSDIKIQPSDLTSAKAEFADRLKNFKPLNSSDERDRVLFEIIKGYGYDYETFKKELWIRRVSTSDFISVDYTSEDGYLSALAVNAVCEEFIRYNKALKVDRSAESIEFLANLVQEKKRVLDQKTTTLNDFKVVNNVTNYSAESESKIDNLADYEKQKEEAEKKIKGLDLSLSAVEAKLKGVNKSNQDEAIKVNQRIIELRRQISDLNSAGAEANKTKLNQLRDELQLEVSRLDAINTRMTADEVKELEKQKDQYNVDLKIARSDLETIEGSLRRLKYDVSGFATKEAKLADLEREVTFASEDYTNVQNKYNDAKNEALVIGSAIRQTLKGQPSYEAEPSKAILMMALAGAGSFVLCISLIIGVEYFDFSIRVASRLERLTGIKNIGSINLVKTKDFDLQKVFNNKNVDKEADRFVHFLRKLRYEVQTSQSKVFLITSTQVNVGKSFIIICLSYTLSLINKKVLIIDTNFRHNSLTKLLLERKADIKLLEKSSFGEKEKVREESETTTNAHGRAEKNERTSNEQSEPNEYTNSNGKHAGNDKSNNGFEFDEDAKANGNGFNDADGDGDHKSIIHHTEFNGVHIIGNIGGHDSPSEILAGRNFKNVIAKLSSSYDYILMEGPSINEYSDTKELVEFSDKVIPIFSADRVLNQLDQESVKYLKSIKGKLLGSVLNKVQLKDLSA